MTLQKIRKLEAIADLWPLALIAVLAAALAVGLFSPGDAAAATATTGATAAPGTPLAAAPRLAPGVKPQAGYEAPTERLMVANPTPIFSDLDHTSAQTGRLDTVGAPVTVLAKVKGYDWLLVGKDGVGIGYVPRSLLTPRG